MLIMIWISIKPANECIFLLHCILHMIRLKPEYLSNIVVKLLIVVNYKLFFVYISSVLPRSIGA